MHEHDADGRLLRSTTEPEWDDEQQGWAQAHALLQADTCSGCGGWLSETTQPDREGQYEVPPPHRCHRCTSLSIKRREYAEKTQHAHALHFIVRPRIATPAGRRHG